MVPPGAFCGAAAAFGPGFAAADFCCSCGALLKAGFAAGTVALTGTAAVAAPDGTDQALPPCGAAPDAFITAAVLAACSAGGVTLAVGFVPDAHGAVDCFEDTAEFAVVEEVAELICEEIFVEIT